MHFDTRNNIHGNADLRKLAEFGVTIDFPPSHPATKPFETVLSYLTSANSLKQLERFADERQPYLCRQPWPDGSNLTQDFCTANPPAPYHPDLEIEYKFRRLWIRHLHFPDLHAANIGREESIRQLYTCGRLVGFSWIS